MAVKQIGGVFGRNPTFATVTTTGNVGIGTSSPLGRLHVAASGLAQQTWGDTGEATDQKNWALQTGTTVGVGVLRLRAINDAFTNGQNAFIVTRNGFAVETHQWLTAGAERMRITSTGNVGINENAPDYKLDVNGALGFTPGASVTPVDNGDVVFELTNNTTLTIKAKGSDGVVRSAAVTLAP